MKTLKAALSFGLLAVLAVSHAQATVIVTYAEKAGAETTSLVNSSTLTFDAPAYTLGVHNTAGDPALTWGGVGTFNQLNIKSADQYGGAYDPATGKSTQYSVQGVGSSVSQTTLNLNSASGYFGLWWSAGDAANVLDFYSGLNGTGTLLAEFTTANLLKTLPKAYYGNPNPGTNLGKDSGEPFAFINFFAVEGTAWNSIIFRNSSGSGFESDNYTSRVEAYNPSTDGAMPGVVLEAINGTHAVLIPEPGATFALLLVGGLSAGGSFLRRIKKQA